MTSDRNAPPSNRELLTLLGIFGGFIILVLWLIWLAVDNIVWFIPPQVEQQLGAIVAPAYEKLAQPSPAQDTLNQMLDRLENNLPVANRQGRNYQVLYIPEKTINALALPGDRIIIYAGLVAQAKSENELMMVMGHELGHFANRDHLRGLGRGILVQIALSSIFGDSGALGGAVASTIESVSSAQYSQNQERQADDFGLILLEKTYGQVAGATDFFARMAAKYGLEIEFLASHPSPKNRVVRLQSLIEKRNLKIGKLTPLPASLVEDKKSVT